MDIEQIAYFKQRYASMGDDELALLVATRREVLSEEARTALAEVLKTKNVGHFIQEVNTTVDDLNSQAHAAGEYVRRQKEHNRKARRSLAFFFAFVFVVGVLMAVFR